MLFMHNSRHRKPLAKFFAALLIIGVIIAAALIFTNAQGIRNMDETAGISERPFEPINKDDAPQRLTLTGTYTTCLPKQDNFSKEPCVAGMKTDANEYYAVDFALMSQMGPKPVLGERFTASGVFIPYEKLGTSTVPFVGKGLFSVTNDVNVYIDGEADPNRMTLTMKTWNWVSALYNDGREIKPKTAGKFTLTFDGKGRFAATTDCNHMSGTYTLGKDKTLTFGPIAMTKMFCEGSQESEFAKLLENTSHYHFTARGQLILDIKFDSGTVTFN